MKKLFAVFGLALLTVLLAACNIPNIFSTTAAPPPTTTYRTTTFTPPPTTVITSVRPTTAVTTPPPTTIAITTFTPDLGSLQQNYDVQQTLTFTNEGPGKVTTMSARVALVKTTAPYQTVNSIEANPSSYTTSTDAYGNEIALFNFSNVAAGAQVNIVLHYSVTAYSVHYTPKDSPGDLPADYLKPEKWIESDDVQITALAGQITAGITSSVEKARAIYNWIGDNIQYLGYQSGMKGAVWCLENKGGDCTEFACLMAALCRAAGVPARFVEGLGFTGNTGEDPKHDWTEIYLAGSGWVPVDATWGRYNSNRDKYFAAMTPDHIKVTTGNPSALGQYTDAFCYAEYQYYYTGLPTTMSLDDAWSVINRSRPSNLLCTDEEYQRLSAVYSSWGWDFNLDFARYAKQGQEGGWTWFWMGSTTDESRRLYFDKSGSGWKPRDGQ